MKSWNQTKEIILSERDDEQKDPNALSHALAHFHRYGPSSRYLQRSSDRDLNQSKIENLTLLLNHVISSPRTILYFGPKSPDHIEIHPKLLLSKVPNYIADQPEPDRSIQPENNQIYFLQKKWLRLRLGLNFLLDLLDESLAPSIQLFNEYLGGGMAGLVFQELREARALAYSAWARFFTPARPNEENVLVGSIGCQADKTLDAIEAFIGLLKNMPLNQTRFDSALTSLLSNYRTNPITSRAIPRFVYDIHALGLADVENHKV